ncbi:ImcF-related family protein, partial [Paraburkholderia sediminicola]|uniref:ImcF-related family protein n=3 Tax=Paraburkholderia sediminicola TaxID=458836 RepID=UPI0038BDE03D
MPDPDDAKLGKRSIQDSYRAGVIRLAEEMNWSAPIYVLNAEGQSKGQEADLVACDFPRRTYRDAIAGALHKLRDRLAYAGVQRLGIDRRDTYLARLSRQLDARYALLTDLCVHLGDIKRLKQSVRGIFFMPVPQMAGTALELSPGAQSPIWYEIGQRARRAGGVRIGWHPSTVGATIVTACVCLWIAGMAVSAGANTRELLFAKTVVQDTTTARDDHPGLHALLDLQHEIERFEYRATDGAPWYSRFGLNRDAAILKGLWQAYAPASRRLLVTPTQQGLENALASVAAMRTDVADSATTQQAVQGHKTLKTYLMMAEPPRADAKLMEPEMIRNWLTHAALTLGERQDLGHQFFQFFAQHLPSHPDWAIQPRADLVNGTRQTLLAITGVKNSTETLYHSILDAAGGKYGDQSLATMLAGTDATGLFHTSATVPGV